MWWYHTSDAAPHTYYVIAKHVTMSENMYGGEKIDVDLHFMYFIVPASF